MDTRLGHVLSFLAGATISGLSAFFITKKVVEKKYAAIAQEEINSVKEHFTMPKDIAKSIKEKKEKEKELKKEDASKKAINKPSLSEYAKNIKSYVNYSNSENKEEIGNNSLKRISFKPNGSIRVIEPEEFGEDEEYDQVSLTFYADGILADEDDRIISDVEGLIGKDSLDRIGEYEDDALHVKNEALKTYYEILEEERSYEKATGKKPPEHPEKED